ncbi:hypothetical protein CJU90_3453 [Yarrowia sp. C11]|nr:hypothetical protein CKK34_4899 [Yarrowia sp. E02]KAG5369913.1 hypothetical protein CJU90_3453 [Yarrowia sp. C11]
MPFLTNHPCDLTSYTEFYETDEVRDAFYSKPNTILKRNYVVGLNKESKACLQAEITKKYNSQKSRRLGYLPIPKWTWYSVRFCELTSPMNLLAGKEISYNKPPKTDDVAMPRPATSLKRGKRVRRNNRPGRLRVFAAMIAENKQLERTTSCTINNVAFTLPGTLYDWVEFASIQEEGGAIFAKTPAQRGVLKREKELHLERKRMEHLRCSRKEFLVEGMA